MNGEYKEKDLEFWDVGEFIISEELEVLENDVVSEIFLINVRFWFFDVV